MNPRIAKNLFDHTTPTHTRLASLAFPPIQNRNNIDWILFETEYNRCQAEMRTKHLWFEDGLNYNFRPAVHKKIALGRAPFYIQFVDFYFKKYGERLYLLDLMLRQDGLDGQESLLYFIEDAEEIHVNLEGVLPEELSFATVGIGRLANDKTELNAPYTTAWEINQIFYKELLDITYFHTGSSMSRWKAYNSMGRMVPLKRIKSDNMKLLDEWKEELGRKEVEELEEL